MRLAKSLLLHYILEPEAQIHAFKILEKHYQQNFCALSNFSNTLLSKGYFDQVIELLEIN